MSEGKRKDLCLLSSFVGGYKEVSKLILNGYKALQLDKTVRISKT